MINYTTNEGLLYTSKLLNGFVNSDFYEGEEKEKLVLNEQELLELMSKKSFKDYVVQRERDYTLLSSFLAESSYQYDEGFGSLLDINAGKYDVSSLFDTFNNTTPTVLTSYSDPNFFEEGIEVYNGSLEIINLIQEGYTLARPIIKCNEKVPLISRFDSFIYANDIEVYKLLTLYRYSLEKNKKFIGGVVTNIYDKNIAIKLQMMKEIIENLRRVLNDSLLIDEIHSSGSVIKLIHTLY